MQDQDAHAIAHAVVGLIRDELLEVLGRTRVWLSVEEVQARTGRGRTRVIEALQTGLAHRDAGGYRPGDLRGYQAGARSGWAIHVDDADAWVRCEAPAPVRAVGRAA